MEKGKGKMKEEGKVKRKILGRGERGKEKLREREREREEEAGMKKVPSKSHAALHMPNQVQSNDATFLKYNWNIKSHWR